jgi:hypothetical protein
MLRNDLALAARREVRAGHSGIAAGLHTAIANIERHLITRRNQIDD